MYRPLGRHPLGVIGMDSGRPARTQGLVESQTAEGEPLVIRRQQPARGVELHNANGGEPHERVQLHRGVGQFDGSLRDGRFEAGVRLHEFGSGVIAQTIELAQAGSRHPADGAAEHGHGDHQEHHAEIGVIQAGLLTPQAHQSQQERSSDEERDGPAQQSSGTAAILEQPDRAVRVTVLQE